ncbi:MAG: alpha-L-fucosidase, partial [Bacteroidales bacterium]
MFIHWGLYSQLGGVWDGKPVEWGYSEQIQSFAGIFSDYYAATAEKFTAEKWNADSIVALAKAAQMKSIVITAKHHDGFSMYATKCSDYNVVEATPFGRDPLMELSKACAKAGLRFGVYFSLIDWHFPQAYPISSSNADPITLEHHKHNINQVRELLTNYGPISEIWFDMGSLTREQSRELYTLVTTLQPQCMVSGRLGNDFGDFAVMADNACPNYPIEIPWQTAGSVFKETWSYRSWQKRDNLQDKIAEKIATLKNVIGHGGNYLLNIGPRGDGSVVEFERDLLLAMGKWLTDSSNVIYRVPKVNSNILPTIGELNYSNATPFYGYSCFDYYSSFRSI